MLLITHLRKLEDADYVASGRPGTAPRRGHHWR